MAFGIRIFERKTVRSQVLMVFIRQLATLIDAGFPLLTGLTLLYQQEKNPVFRRVLRNLMESLCNGATFAESLSKHPEIFDRFFVNMVHAGETGGVLVDSFLRLAESQEKAHKLKNKILAAVAYPCMVLMTAFGIVCFLLGIVVPKFQSLLPEISGDKPLPQLTRLVAHTSHFFSEHFFGILVGFAALALLLHYAPRIAKVKYVLDSWKLKLPLLGELLRKQAIASFSRTVGMLISNGVPILQALALGRETLGNSYIAAAIDRIHEELQSGEPLGSSSAATRVFPALALSMMSVGEETGQLPHLLLKVADIYDDEVENALARLTSLLEPVIIAFLAILIGTIVIALFLPLVSIATDLSGP